MKVNFLKYLILALLVAIPGRTLIHGAEKKRIVGYVTSWGTTLPDPRLLTNINYAFGHVNKSFDGVRIDNPSRLKEVVGLKKKNSRLQVQLSIGGWGSGGFSEMAADAEKRKAFAIDCKRIMKEYGLDGIDIDWEYPGSSRAGIGSSTEDRDNFVLLMRDLRKELGKNALLTFASPATVGFYEFKPVMPYIDFINVMTYDLNRPPYHHSSLYRSKLSGDMTVDEGIKAHVSGGVPAEKLVLGVPFYGHGDKSVYPDFVNYNKLSLKEGLAEKFDDKAGVPYYVDEEGRLVMTFENPESLKLKADYVKKNGLGGMMIWELGGDTGKQDLLKTVKKALGN